MQKIINETVFTMEVESFVLKDEEKDTLIDVLNGKVTFHAKLQEYIENAKHRGVRETINVNS